MADEKPSDVPWYAPGYAAANPTPVTKPKPRERLWTLMKGGYGFVAELLFHANEMGLRPPAAGAGERPDRRVHARHRLAASRAVPRPWLIDQAPSIPRAVSATRECSLGTAISLRNLAIGADFL